MEQSERVVWRDWMWEVRVLEIVMRGREVIGRFRGRGGGGGSVLCEW